MVLKGRAKMNKRKRTPSRLNGLWILLGIVIALPALLMTILVAVPAVSPTTGAETADFLRSVFGPEPVAQLESLSYWMRDVINRSFLSANNGKPQVNWSSSGPVGSEILTSTPNPMPTVLQHEGLSQVNPVGTPPPTAAIEGLPDPPTDDVLTAPPQIGWQAYGPLMARAILMVDPDRSYAAVALVRIDLSRLQLHMMAGFIEPAHPSGINKLIPDLGMVPPQDKAKLIAAFNGGFKAVHGHYGMMENGTILLQPVDGMATVAVYRDGSVRMGVWGRDLFSSPDMVSFRQNCPPLIDAGQINPAVSTDARKIWGFTNNSDIMWRTGLGITYDRHYLIYGVGNGTSAQFLAEALQKAGAYMAMQLDINQYYAHFVTYLNANNSASAAGDQLIVEPLLDKMIAVRNLFLVPYPRDFFYLTLRE
jgi:hypothetical protein